MKITDVSFVPVSCTIIVAENTTTDRFQKDLYECCNDVQSVSDVEPNGPTKNSTPEALRAVQIEAENTSSDLLSFIGDENSRDDFKVIDIPSLNLNCKFSELLEMPNTSPSDSASKISISYEELIDSRFPNSGILIEQLTTNSKLHPGRSLSDKSSSTTHAPEISPTIGDYKGQSNKLPDNVSENLQFLADTSQSFDELCADQNCSEHTIHTTNTFQDVQGITDLEKQHFCCVAENLAEIQIYCSNDIPCIAQPQIDGSFVITESSGIVESIERAFCGIEVFTSESVVQDVQQSTVENANDRYKHTETVYSNADLHPLTVTMAPASTEGPKVHNITSIISSAASEGNDPTLETYSNQNLVLEKTLRSRKLVSQNFVLKKKGAGRSVYKHVPHKEKPVQAVERRNARERRRVQSVNSAFLRLRRALPSHFVLGRGKRISKVKTLQAAMNYIWTMQRLLAQSEE